MSAAEVGDHCTVTSLAAAISTDPEAERNPACVSSAAGFLAKNKPRLGCLGPGKRNADRRPKPVQSSIQKPKKYRPRYANAPIATTAMIPAQISSSFCGFIALAPEQRDVAALLRSPRRQAPLHRAAPAGREPRHRLALGDVKNPGVHFALRPTHSTCAPAGGERPSLLSAADSAKAKGKAATTNAEYSQRTVLPPWAQYLIPIVQRPNALDPYTVACCRGQG